ncbi:MAG TPA: tRNA 4-thiouridine(8) synthase ThiI, partial [Ruminococcaceae bacterium]|nr:tRNA 4-thiouridine(8) synthase ThiI [Oscillospiraceae bacterium]
EDCCTVFSPKHPRTRPTIEEVLEAESGFDFEKLLDEAVEKTEVKRFRYGEKTIYLE